MPSLNLKIIFLDIDGVLVPLGSSHNSLDQWYDDSAYPFNVDCVIVLNEILEKTRAEIVLISTWQFMYDLETLQDIFKFNRVESLPIDSTKDYGNDKIEEVLNYIRDNDIENYVVLDDKDLSKLGTHFIQIDGTTGLTEDYIDAILNILKI
ncbi:MAG: HAD domain-containing protein [Alphaproteobacteria bacterium]|nr:HAD domain-containing protein [Alphaproteobacteria bacterium]